MSEFNEDLMLFSESVKIDDIDINDLVDINLFLNTRNVPIEQDKNEISIDTTSIEYQPVEDEILLQENRRKKRCKCIMISCSIIVIIIPILGFLKYKLNILW